jgi:hypothetical protein
MRNARFACLAIASVGVLASGCGERPSVPSTQNTTQSSRQPSPPKPQPPVAPPPSLVPSSFPYSINSETTVPGVKRSIEVRLTRKASAEDLRLIALELKAKDPRRYDRTFITYYLPHMAVGEGAWATTHFNPDLDVKILGLTTEEADALSAAPAPQGQELIGRWLDESPLVGGRISIVRERGKLYLENVFKDGGSGRQEVTETKSPLGRRFDALEKPRSGDHWILDFSGNLQIRDNDGLIATAKKLDAR